MSILLAARSYGLTANAFKGEPSMVKESAIFPCIIHWEFNHFVVLDGFKRGKVYLNDPARGKVVISEEEFDKGFTGVIMMFEPGEDFEPSGKKKSVFEFAKKRLEGTGAAMAFTILVSVISAAFGLINPAMTRTFMDRFLQGRNPDWVVMFLVIMFLLAFAQLVVAWIQAVYSLRIQGKMAVVGNMTYMWKILRLPMEFFSQRMTGDILQRQSTNASIAGTLVNTFAPLLLNTVMMVVYLTVMLRQSLMLTLIGVICMSVNLLNSIIISGKRVNITRVQQRDTGKLSSLTMNGIRMIETIKASGAEDGFFRKWSGLQASVNEQSVNFQRIGITFGLIGPCLSAVADILVMIMGIFLVMQGEFTVGMIYSFQAYLTSFMGPVSTLISAGQTIQEMRTDMERVEDVMEYPDDPASAYISAAAEPAGSAGAEAADMSGSAAQGTAAGGTGKAAGAADTSGAAAQGTAAGGTGKAAGAADMSGSAAQGTAAGTTGKAAAAAGIKPAASTDYRKLSGEVEIRNISFGYATLRPPLIEDFSIHIKPGSRVAFVGASGCGKSTIAKLISGLYEPWTGEILFDGIPVRQIDRSVLTGSLAVVDQDRVLFEDTSAANIRMWDNTIEDFEVIMAARDAQIHDDIMQREGGYESRLTEGGNDLSGGQRQRLELARVLAQDPTIIILDEATSALDAKTEYNVVKAITDRGITCIVVAHRLSTIRDCDEILVMDHGKVVERGTHEELYAKGGLYTSLVTNE